AAALRALFSSDRGTSGQISRRFLARSARRSDRRPEPRSKPPRTLRRRSAHLPGGPDAPTPRPAPRRLAPPRSPQAAQTLAGWAVDPALRGFSNLEEVIAEIHRRGRPAESDRILLALLRRA